MALTDKLTAIADAIREKTGSMDSMTLDEMATIISDELTISTADSSSGSTSDTYTAGDDSDASTNNTETFSFLAYLYAAEADYDPIQLTVDGDIFYGTLGSIDYTGEWSFLYDSEAGWMLDASPVELDEYGMTLPDIELTDGDYILVTLK